MKALLFSILLLCAAATQAQYANKVTNTTFEADLKISGKDTTEGKWIVSMSEEWFGYNKQARYAGQLLYWQGGAYRNDQMTITLDVPNRRFEVMDGDNYYYLIRKEDLKYSFSDAYEIKGRKPFTGAKDWRTAYKH